MSTCVSSRGGYTLVELLVVVALIAGLSSTLVLNVTNSRNVTHVDAAARQIVSMVHYAQAVGQSGNATSDSDPLARYDQGYGVYFLDGANTFTLYEGAGPGPQLAHSAYQSANEKETVALSHGVTITDVCMTDNLSNCSGSGSATEANIHFRRGQSSANILDESNTNSAYAVITVGVGGESRRVTIVNTGLVYAD